MVVVGVVPLSRSRLTLARRPSALPTPSRAAPSGSTATVRCTSLSACLLFLAFFLCLTAQSSPPTARRVRLRVPLWRLQAERSGPRAGRGGSARVPRDQERHHRRRPGPHRLSLNRQAWPVFCFFRLLARSLLPLLPPAHALCFAFQVNLPGIETCVLSARAEQTKTQSNATQNKQ